MGEVPRGIYFILCPEWLEEGRNWQTTLQIALEAGCALVQLRIKHMDTRKFYSIAKLARLMCLRAKVPFLINDRLDLALAVEADGTHVGQADLPAPLARRLLPEGAILGVTTPTDQARREALQAGADYLTCGPVYLSETAPMKPAVGVKELQRVRQAFPEAPLCAIGGINVENVDEVLAAKPDLVAVSEGIQSARDPIYAARELVKRWKASQEG